MTIRTLALLAIATVFATAGNAQGIHAGVKGGVNMFKIDGRAFSQEYHHGYNAGLFAEINFSKKVGIQPEVLWNQSQTRTSTQFDDFYDDGVGELRDVKLNYLSVPLLLSYHPSKFLTIQAGPQFGVLIENDVTLLENGKSAFKSGDLSMLGGVQFNLGGFKLGGRYVVGLNNINDIDERDKWRNQGFHLYAGFRLF